MNRAMIEGRIATLKRILAQAGKRLSADTVSKINTVIDNLNALLAGDAEEVTEEAAQQAWTSMAQVFCQTIVSGETTADSWQARIDKLQSALRSLKAPTDTFPWVMYAWDDHLIYEVYEKQADGRYGYTLYRIEYSESDGGYTFTNEQKWTLEQVGFALQSLIEPQGGDTSLEPTDHRFGLLDRGDDAPLMLQTMSGSVRLTGQSTADGRPIIRGIATQGNVPNKWRKPVVWPTELWASELGRMQDLITQGKAVGTLDHTWDDKGQYREPEPAEYAIKFTSLSQEGDLFPFEAEVLGTSRGKELQALLDAGVQFDMSTVAAGKWKQQKWGGKDALVVQSEGFRWHRIADVVMHGASPGATITDVRLQALDAEEPGEEKAAMKPEEIQQLIQQAIEAGNTALATQLQALKDKIDGLEAQGLSEEDKVALAEAKEIVSQAKADKQKRELDSRITEFVSQMVKDEVLPQQFTKAATAHFEGLCQSAEDVEGQKDAVLKALGPTLELHNNLKSQGFYMKEHRDDGTKLSKVGSLGEAVDELVQSAKERKLIQPYTPQSSMIKAADGEQLRDFNDMEQNLRVMIQTLVQAHPEYAGAYLKLRNGELKMPGQAFDVMSPQATDYLMQATGDGLVKGDLAGALPYVLPLMVEIWPQLVAGLFATIQPLTKSSGRVYFLKHRYDDDDKYINDPDNFTGSYTADPGEITQVKYINAEISYSDVTPFTKKLGWKSSAEALRNLMADFGIDGRSDLVRMTGALIALEWNFNHLASIKNGATAGNVNYGTAIPSNNAFDGEQWHKQIHRFAQQARGLIWKKTFAESIYIFGDSDSIDWMIDATEKGQYTANGRGTIARGVDIVGSLSNGEQLVKVGWWDQIPGNTNKLVFAGAGRSWFDRGFAILPYLGLYVTPEWTNPDTQQTKQSMMSQVAEKMLDGNYYSTLTILPGTAGTPIGSE